MIKINLTPVDELENRYWWVPDAVVCAAVMAAAYFGAQYYLGLIRDDLAAVTATTEEYRANYDALKGDLERFKNLDNDIAELKTKIDALSKITVSRIQKYKPVVVLEHLQNLRPEGVWFKKIEINANDGFKVYGQAFDNILVAEFMTSLKATETQDSDPSDLRTQVHFMDVRLETTAVPKAPDGAFPELARFPEFSLDGLYVERGKEPRALQDEAEEMETFTNLIPSDKTRM